MRLYVQFVLSGLLICHGPLLVADPARQYLDLSMGYTRGDFGTGQNTTVSQLQMTYGQMQGRYDFSATLPYLFLSDRFGDEHGVGDIILRGGAKLSDDPFANNEFYVSLAVKLPSADESKGLGTGEADVGGYITYTHYFNGAQYSLLGGYIKTGDAANQVYNDVLVYGASIAKMSIPWYFYAGLDGSQQTLDTGDDPLEVSVGCYYQLKPTVFLKAEGLVGLNDASPDHGVTVGIVNWF